MQYRPISLTDPGDDDAVLRRGYHGSARDLIGSYIVPAKDVPGGAGGYPGVRANHPVSPQNHTNYVVRNALLPGMNQESSDEWARDQAWVWAGNASHNINPNSPQNAGTANGRPRVYEVEAEGPVGADPNIVVDAENAVQRGSIPMAADRLRVVDTDWVPPGEKNPRLPEINWNRHGIPNVSDLMAVNAEHLSFQDADERAELIRGRAGQKPKRKRTPESREKRQGRSFRNKQAKAREAGQLTLPGFEDV